MEKKTKKPSKKSSLEDRFVDLLELDTPTIITLYGRPGTGKTTIACTGPKPLLLIDVKDKGTYKIVTGKGEESYAFTIGDGIYDDTFKSIVKMLYLQRCKQKHKSFHERVFESLCE